MVEYVQLRVPGDKPRVAKVEEDQGEVLVVAAPPVHLGLLEPPAGTVLDVGFGAPGTRLWSPGVVTEASQDGLLAIRILGEAVAHDRRRHLRVPAEIELTVFVPQSPGPVHGTCIDVSEGGLQAVIPLALEVGESLRIGLELEDGSDVETTARVVRRIEGHRFGLAYELLLKGPRARAFALALRNATRTTSSVD